jgi:hypothetical protein
VISIHKIQGIILSLLFIAACLSFNAARQDPNGGSELLAALPALAACALFLRLFLGAVAVNQEDQAWLIRLCFLALLLRVVMALSVYFGPLDRIAFAEDQSGYDILPQHLTRFWQGAGPEPTFLFEGSHAQRIGYYCFVAAQYFVFGVSPLVPRVVNSLGGALLVIYAYRLAHHVFGQAEAKLAAVWTALFPSLVLWSALNLRDVWLALTILVIIWHTLLLRERVSVPSLGILLVGMVWIYYNRPYLCGIMAVVVTGMLVLARSEHWGRDLCIAGLFLALLFVLQLQLGGGESRLEFASLARIEHYRKGMSNSRWAHSGYLSDVNVTNPVELLLFLPAGVIYFLLSPFPWQISSLRQLITLPEILVWYWTVPYVLSSARQALRDRTRRPLALLVPLAVISFAYALGSGNAGTAYRHRSQIMTIYLVFATAGILHRQRWREAYRQTIMAPTLPPGRLTRPAPRSEAPG